MKLEKAARFFAILGSVICPIATIFAVLSHRWDLFVINLIFSITNITLAIH